VVNAGSDLTADSIVQNSLTIGTAAGTPSRVVIRPSTATESAGAILGSQTYRGALLVAHGQLVPSSGSSLLAGGSSSKSKAATQPAGGLLVASAQPDSSTALDSSLVVPSVLGNLTSGGPLSSESAILLAANSSNPTLGSLTDSGSLLSSSPLLGSDPQQVVPEPSTLVLLGLGGVLGLLFAIRRRAICRS
jgi:PEP-CTERM motif-containing protein